MSRIFTRLSLISELYIPTNKQHIIQDLFGPNKLTLKPTITTYNIGLLTIFENGVFIWLYRAEGKCTKKIIKSEDKKRPKVSLKIT